MAIINILAHHHKQQLPASPRRQWSLAEFMIMHTVHGQCFCICMFACVCLLKNISSQLSREAATITILVYKQIANELERIFQIDNIRK